MDLLVESWVKRVILKLPNLNKLQQKKKKKRSQMNISSSGNFLGTICEAVRLNSTKSGYGDKIFHYQGNIAEFTKGKMFACKEQIQKKKMPKIISTMQ